MMDILTHDTNFWLALSFALFAFVLYKKGKGALLSLLDQRIEGIKKDIETAESLHTEAQELLAQYQRKHRNAVEEAAEIVANAEKAVATIRADAEKELEETMARRERQLTDRLERMKQSAIVEIQKYAAELSVEATKEIIAGQLDKKANDALIDQGIKDLKAKL